MADAQSDALVRGDHGGLQHLREIMRRLRDPATGCPWDIEQTFATIAPYTIEEAYEVADAIARGEMGELEGELGDLLLQVVFHAQMAEEAGLFGFDDVARAISDKMLARHPHVFGGESRDKSSAQQTADWEKIKAAERGPARVLDGVALGLPALTRAVKLQKRAARVGFDWPSTDEVVAKIAEEAAELVEALARTGKRGLLATGGGALVRRGRQDLFERVQPAPDPAALLQPNGRGRCRRHLARPRSLGALHPQRTGRWPSLRPCPERRHPLDATAYPMRMWRNW